MRSPTDALRSVGRQLDVVLNAGPAIVAEVYFGTHRWTHRGMAPGALNVSEAQWTWLRSLPLDGPEPVAQYGRRWERRKLSFDPAADIVTQALPTTGAPVAAPGSLPPLEDNPWEVRYAAERGEVTFPFCRVSMPVAATTSGSAQFYVVSQPMLVECYPHISSATAEAAVIAATDVMGTLLSGFRGISAGLGQTMRVPLYDYDGVPLEEGVTDRRLEHDFLRVEDFAPRLLPDAADPRRVAVVADMRVSWRVPVSHRGRTRVVDSLRFEIAGS